MADRDPNNGIVARIAEGVAALPKAAWDACNASGNPFMSHDFLSALEDSGSVGPGTGWKALPIVINDADDRIAAALPAYVKGHSQGEYVFDHAWADAYERAGGRYYPKLQIASPFSPVPGPRLLLRDSTLAPALLTAAEMIVKQNGLSSAHATFVEEAQLPLFEAAGWLIRQDSQFHWTNRGYGSFDDFLLNLSSRKRKDIRKERAAAVAGLEIVHLTGGEISEAHLDIFWHFYQDTGARKWGRPYLTRACFSLLVERMADRMLLILALRDGRAIAGALNMIGPQTLYGRYWGCVEDVPFLHFELCYYQAIDFAIARGLQTVEAGAQGEHKLARGYAPVPTWSAHYIADPRFRAAVDDFLVREREAAEQEREWLSEKTPFRRE
ncbi:MAG TPA: GNAT family N-acetyltransferase [Rhizorhapis sp.]